MVCKLSNSAISYSPFKVCKAIALLSQFALGSVSRGSLGLGIRPASWKPKQIEKTGYKEWKKCRQT